MNEEKIKKDIKGAIELARSIHDDVVTNLVEADVDSTVKEQALVISSDLATLVLCLEHTAGSALELACSILDDVVTNFVKDDVDSTIKKRALAVSHDLATLALDLAHIIEGVS